MKKLKARKIFIRRKLKDYPAKIAQRDADFQSKAEGRNTQRKILDPQVFTQNFSLNLQECEC